MMTDVASGAGQSNPAQPGVRGAFQFLGERSPLFYLILKTFFLMIVTLGIYRFWFVTRKRKFFWENTTLDNHSFEYIGQGSELFLGFVIGSIILSPVFIIYNLLISFYPEYAFYTIAVFAIILYLAFPFFIYRAFRYRFSRTLWKRVRFTLAGKGFSYALRSFIWALILILTLGLAAPFMRIDLWRHMANDIRFGSLKGHYNGSIGVLFKPYFIVWIITIIAAVIACLWTSIYHDSFIELAPYMIEGFEEEIPDAGFLGIHDPEIVAYFFYIYAVIFAALIVSVLSIPYIYSMTIKAQLNYFSIGECSFKNTLNSSPIWGILIAYSAFTFIPFGFGALILLDGHFAVGITIIILAYIGFLFVPYLIWEFGFWKAIVMHTAVHNIDALEKAVQEAGAASALSEGFADAMEIDVGF